MKNSKKLRLPLTYVALDSDVFEGMVFGANEASELFRVVQQALIVAGLQIHWVHVDNEDWGIEFTEVRDQETCLPVVAR